MRIKNILLLIVCICLTTIFYCILIGDPKPTINTLHKHLSHLKVAVINGKPFNNKFNYNNNNNNDINSEENERKCDQYLRQLGFSENRTLLKTIVDSREDSWLTNTSLASAWPVFVTAVTSDQLDLTKGFIKSFRDFLYNNYSLIVYDLGLSKRQLISLNSVCNESQTQNTSQTEATFQTLSSKSLSPLSGNGMNWCTIRSFDFDSYPAHVSDLKLSAYRPIILQLVLNELGSALWLDPNHYPIPLAAPKVVQLAQKAKREGILSWTIEQPTTSLTHPKMFEYFKTNQNQYFFHRMVRPSNILLFNTKRIHRQLMRPWLKCVLTHECIAPIGSQASGCRFDKKPLYRYSGCHNYDTSALNVVLGQLFDFNEKPYSAAEEEKFFKIIAIDDDVFTDDDIIEIDYISNSISKPLGPQYTNKSTTSHTTNRN